MWQCQVTKYCTFPIIAIGVEFWLLCNQNSTQTKSVRVRVVEKKKKKRKKKETSLSQLLSKLCLYCMPFNSNTVLCQAVKPLM